MSKSEGWPGQCIPRNYGRFPIKPDDIVLEPGYVIEPVVTGLTYPTSVTFDEWVYRRSRVFIRSR